VTKDKDAVTSHLALEALFNGRCVSIHLRDWQGDVMSGCWGEPPEQFSSTLANPPERLGFRQTVSNDGVRDLTA
jgi:hypothetical protein